MDWIELCDAIDDGEYDEGLQEIARTIQTRMDVTASRKARRMLADLTPGTRVMIVNRPTPRYLEGMVGTINKVDIQNQAARVELDEKPTPGRGRPSAGGISKRIVIPLIHLNILDDDYEPPVPDDEIGDDEDYEGDED